MNHWIGMGRLTKDPEVRYLQNANNTAVASFNVAIDRKYKRDGDPSADFFNCTAFGKLAEFCEKYLKKGTKIVLEGHLQNDTYEKDGKKNVITKIMVDSIEFAESKNGGQTDSDNAQEEVKRPRRKTQQQELEDELPFA